MSQTTSFYPSLSADDRGTHVVSHAGAVLLTRTATTVGLDDALAAALTPWRAPRAIHHPGKVVLDLAVSIAIGGDALSDIALLRAEPQVFGPVASDPTVSRLIDTLAADAESSLAAIDTARAAARATAWSLAGADAPDHDSDARRPLVVDIVPRKREVPPASLVGAHSEKESAAPTFKRGFGFHPICAFVVPNVNTAPAAPGSRWHCTYDPAAPARTPSSITSRSPRRRWPSCPATAAPTPPAGVAAQARTC